MDVHDSSDDDVVEKDVVHLAKNFRKFLKFKNSGKFGDKGKFQSLGREKREFKRKDGKESQSTQDVTCFEFNPVGDPVAWCVCFSRDAPLSFSFFSLILAIILILVFCLL